MRLTKVTAIVVATFLLTSSISVAQYVDTLWTRTYAHDYADTLSWVEETSDHGFIMAGGTVLQGRTDFDYSLVKTDSLGDLEWSVLIGDEHYESAYHVLEDYDGGYLVSGRSSLTGPTGSLGGVWIVKTDDVGDTVWTFPWCPDNRGAYPLDATLTFDSCYAIVGVVNLADGSYNDAFILVLDRDGEHVDHAFYGDNYWQEGWFITQLPDSGFMIAGVWDNDWWALRTDKSLVTQWDSVYALSTSYDYLHGACVDGDAMVMVGTNYAAGHALKIDLDGNTLFSKPIGITRTDEMYNAVCTTPDGGYMVGGYHGVAGHRTDFCVIKLNSELDTLWSYSVGGADDDHGKSLVRTYDDNYALAGTTYSFTNVQEFWLTKIGSCCSGRVGDVNGVGGDDPTLGDVSWLIDALFITNDTDILTCLTEADVNQSGGAEPVGDDITIGDISILIDYLFITGPSLGLPECL